MARAGGAGGSGGAGGQSRRRQGEDHGGGRHRGEVDRFYLVVNSGGGTRAAIPEMKRNGGGHIGNVGSIAG